MAWSAPVPWRLGREHSAIDELRGWFFLLGAGPPPLPPPLPPAPPRNDDDNDSAGYTAALAYAAAFAGSSVGMAYAAANFA